MTVMVVMVVAMAVVVAAVLMVVMVMVQGGGTSDSGRDQSVALCDFYSALCEHHGLDLCSVLTRVTLVSSEPQSVFVLT